MGLAGAGTTADSPLVVRRRLLSALLVLTLLGMPAVASARGLTLGFSADTTFDPALIDRYEADGELPTIPAAPTMLPAPAEAEIAVAALLTASP